MPRESLTESRIYIEYPIAAPHTSSSTLKTLECRFELDAIFAFKNQNKP
jgi:hypothetical protein